MSILRIQKRKFSPWIQTAVLFLVGFSFSLGAEAPKPENSEDAARLPDSISPQQALAKIDLKGQLTVKRKGCQYKLGTGIDPDTGAEKQVYVPFFILVIDRYKPAEFQAIDTKGKKIEAADLVKLLQKEKVVLISADGEAVDPLHLAILKEGTIVLVLPKRAPKTPY